MNARQRDISRATVASSRRPSQVTFGVTISGEWDWGYGNGQPKIFEDHLDPGFYLEWGLGWRF